MYLHPDHLEPFEQGRVARWLEANGCRHYVALEPVIVRGNVAEYVAMCRKDRKSLARMPVRGDTAVLAGRKKLRIRIPLSAVQ